MTTLPNTTFAPIWNRYTDANSRCHALSGGEGLEAILCRELIEFARSNGVSEPKPLLT
jgi:hypothetical protein